MQSNKNGINGESVKQIPREAYKNLGVWAKRVSEILASRREFVAFVVVALIFWFFWIKPKEQEHFWIKPKEQETSKKNKENNLLPKQPSPKPPLHKATRKQINKKRQP